MDPGTRNPQARAARFWGLAALLGLACVFLPALAGLDGPSGGFALGALGLVVAITGAIGAWVFLRRARALERLLDGEDLIVHWTYAADEWARWAEAEQRSERSARRALFSVTAAIALGVGVIFFLADPRGGSVVLAVMAGLLGVIWIVSTLVLRAARARRERPGEAWIGTGGVYLAGALHTWGTLGSRLERVGERADGPAIDLIYSYPVKGHRQQAAVHVPVPRGHEAEARQVAAALTAAVLADH